MILGQIDRTKNKMKNVLLFIIDLPFRFVFAFIRMTLFGPIGWVGMVLLILKFTGIIKWPWWLVCLPIAYSAVYCIYMTIDGALYRLGLKKVGRYAAWTSDVDRFGCKRSGEN